jgi:ankyrin repeat protein
MQKRKKKKRPPRRHLAFAALEAGDLQMLRMQLAKEPDLAHVRDLNGVTLLMTAVYRGQEDAAAMLVAEGGPLDVFEAVVLGETDRVREILDAGEAKVEEVSPDGFGLLHLSCFYGRDEVARLLLDRGASAERASKHRMGVRPLHSAAAARRWDLVMTILEHGADVNSKQAGGWTALHHAAQQGDRDAASMLLSRGADREAVNDRDQTPADVARGLGHEDLVAVLSGS